MQGYFLRLPITRALQQFFSFENKFLVDINQMFCRTKRQNTKQINTNHFFATNGFPDQTSDGKLNLRFSDRRLVFRQSLVAKPVNIPSVHIPGNPGNRHQANLLQNRASSIETSPSSTSHGGKRKLFIAMETFD